MSLTDIFTLKISSKGKALMYHFRYRQRAKETSLHLRKPYHLFER